MGDSNIKDHDSNKITKKTPTENNNYSWGSLHDSDLNIALQDASNTAQLDTDIDTDIDNEDNFKKTSIDKNIRVSVSDDWGSMNDSQFISFVNKISQSQKLKNQSNNSTVIINQSSSKLVVNLNDDNDAINLNKIESNPTSTPLKCSKPTHTISSSPILFAQKLNSIEPENDFIGIQQDVLTERDIEDSDKYAFNDHNEYFKVKTTKQDRQDTELSEFLKDALSDKQSTYPPLFNNFAIHINGRTEPDILQLRKMIVLHGGKYVHYLSSKGAATHIIAESLPPRKRIQFSNCKVVKPKWIVDSIAQSKLLNWADYRLEQLGDYGQKHIQFKKKIIEPEDDNVDNIDAMNTAYSIEDILSQELSKDGIDAKHPDFLRIFFSKSRLHHLSTWKSDLRSEFLSKAISILKKRQLSVSKPSIHENGRIILHVDFDCFFATVSAKLHNPKINIDKVPCCVTHGGSSADISSCNYAARKFGVSNGMWFSKAKQLCPNIICLPYHFDEYEKISNIFYNKLLSMNIDSILPVSIDEALVDISSICAKSEYSIFETVSKIKSELDAETGCTVSCGCGSNVLLAKLALRQAKPNGVYIAPTKEDDIDKFLFPVDVKYLPGFGNRLYDKLESLVYLKDGDSITLKNLREISKEKLISIFGIKMGEKLYNYSRGIDFSSIDLLSDPDKYMRKSIGIDINWGIRFNTNFEVEDFLYRLAGELSNRLIHCGMLGSNLTLKLSVRHPDAPITPAKYLGMGYCNFVSKTARLGVSTRVQGVLSSEMKYLWRFLNVDPVELRGVGVSMSKLISEGVGKWDTDNQSKIEFKPQVKRDTAEFKQMNALSDKNIVKVDMNSNNTKLKKRNIEYISDEIDWDVFGNLPVDLQEEIKDELKRRRLKSSPKKKKILPNGKDIAVMLSPSKQLPKSSPVKENSLNSMSQKIKEQVESGLCFQGIPVTEEKRILQKLIVWMDFTLVNEKGINDKDLELFREFMKQLINIKDNLRYIRIVKTLSFHLHLNNEKPGYLKWLCEIEHLQLILNEQSYTKFEFQF